MPGNTLPMETVDAEQDYAIWLSEGKPVYMKRLTTAAPHEVYLLVQNVQNGQGTACGSVTLQPGSVIAQFPAEWRTSDKRHLLTALLAEYYTDRA